MKKIILPTLLFVFCFTAESQLTKGNWLVGGTGKFFSYNGTYTNANSIYNTTSKYTDITLSASVGYFPFDKFAFGLRPSFSSFKGKVTSTGGGRTNTNKFLIGPFARAYLLNIEKQFNIVGDVSYQYGVNNWISRKGDINNFSIMAGPELFFNSSIGFEILLGYSFQKETIDDDLTGYTDTKKGVQVSAGFQIHLEKL